MDTPTLTLDPPVARTSLTRGCLALNASYEPLTVIDAKRAIRLVMEGRAEIVEVEGTSVIRSAGHTMGYPIVIRLSRYVNVPRNFRKSVTNHFLFSRDDYRCLYCGRHRMELKPREFLTRDHIVPQSRFNNRSEANQWENVATACNTCNHRKADKTPKEAGMNLLRPASEPHFVKLVWAVRKLTPLQRKYIAMFYGEDIAEALSE